MGVFLLILHNVAYQSILGEEVCLLLIFPFDIQRWWFSQSGGTYLLYQYYKYKHVLYEGACNPATAAEIVCQTSDVGSTERVDHWTDG